MGTTRPGEISFRGVDKRNLNDQLQAMSQGYDNMFEYALNLLAERIIKLEQRMDAFEGCIKKELLIETIESRRGLESDPED